MAATPIWLTDEDSEVPGFLRAKIPFSTNQVNKSDTPSLVRAVETTVAGPATVPVVRMKAGASFQNWLTDPLQGPQLTNGTWIFHAWGNADAGSHVGLTFNVSKYGGTLVVSATSGQLGITTGDVALTSGAAAPQQLVAGDRLLITVALTDVGGTMVAGHSATFSYNGLYSRTEGDTYLLCPDGLTPVGAQQGATIIGDIPDDDILAVRTLLRDFSILSGLSQSPLLGDDEVVRYIIQAVESYSIDRPYSAAYLYSGDGNTFDFPLPPRWIWGVSRLIHTEYPAAQQIPNTLEDLDVEIRDDVLGTQPRRTLRMRTIIPDAVPNNFFIVYSTRHQYSTEYSTIPREDMDAVLWLAGSYCAMAIASRYAGSTDSSIEADVINYRDSQRKWSDVGQNLKKMYQARVIEMDAAVPMGSIQEWRPQNSTGQSTLWHSRRVRRVFY